MRKIILAAAALAGIAAFAVPAAASAGTTPGAVFAVTHSPQHNDTTSGPGGGVCGHSGNGPTWAVDNLEEKFTVTPYATGEYKVIINVVGSFAGFADPGLNGTTDPAQGYCQPLSSNGSVKGTITYYVFSTQGPDSSALLPTQAPTPASARRWASCSPVGSPTTGPPLTQATTCSATRTGTT